MRRSTPDSPILTTSRYIILHTTFFVRLMLIASFVTCDPSGYIFYKKNNKEYMVNTRDQDMSLDENKGTIFDFHIDGDKLMVYNGKYMGLTDNDPKNNKDNDKAVQMINQESFWNVEDHGDYHVLKKHGKCLTERGLKLTLEDCKRKRSAKKRKKGKSTSTDESSSSSSTDARDTTSEDNFDVDNRQKFILGKKDMNRDIHYIVTSTLVEHETFTNTNVLTVTETDTVLSTKTVTTTSQLLLTEKVKVFSIDDSEIENIQCDSSSSESIDKTVPRGKIFTDNPKYKKKCRHNSDKPENIDISPYKNGETDTAKNFVDEIENMLRGKDTDKSILEDHESSTSSASSSSSTTKEKIGDPKTSKPIENDTPKEKNKNCSFSKKSRNKKEDKDKRPDNENNKQVNDDISLDFLKNPENGRYNVNKPYYYPPGAYDINKTVVEPNPNVLDSSGTPSDTAYPPDSYNVNNRSVQKIDFPQKNTTRTSSPNKNVPSQDNLKTGSKKHQDTGKILEKPEIHPHKKHKNGGTKHRYPLNSNPNSLFKKYAFEGLENIKLDNLDEKQIGELSLNAIYDDAIDDLKKNIENIDENENFDIDIDNNEINTKNKPGHESEKAGGMYHLSSAQDPYTNIYANEYPGGGGSIAQYNDILGQPLRGKRYMREISKSYTYPSNFKKEPEGGVNLKTVGKLASYFGDTENTDTTQDVGILNPQSYYLNSGYDPKSTWYPVPNYQKSNINGLTYMPSNYHGDWNGYQGHVYYYPFDHFRNM